MEPNSLFLAPTTPESEAAELVSNSPVAEGNQAPAPSYLGLFSERP